MRGINKVILVGNVGNDPDMKYTQGGMAICTISLATTSVRKDKDGNQQEQTQWHRVKLFGKLGEIAGEYVKKGRQLYIEGSIRYDKFTGQDGVEKYITEIIADEMQMLGGGDRNEGGQRGGGAGRQASNDGGGQRGGGAGRQASNDGGGQRGQRGSGGGERSYGQRGGGPVRPAPSTGPTGGDEPWPDDDVPFVTDRGLW